MTELVVKPKLPQLTITKVRSNFQDCVTFKDKFLSSVCDSTSISNIQTFHYLVSAINGDAKRVIQHIPVSEQGFRVEWEILVERYKNERLIINTHIDNITKLPCLTSENASQLRHLLDTIKCNLEALKAMKHTTESWDMIIIHTLVQRLDIKTQKEWELHMSNKGLPNLQQLYTFLEHRYNALESIANKPKSKEQNNTWIGRSLILMYHNVIHLRSYQIRKSIS